MKRRFALPVTIAVTAEAILLLCFNHPATGSPAPRLITPPLPPLPPIEVVEAVVPPSGDVGGRPEAARPSAVLPEPPPVPRDDKIAIDTPPAQKPSILPTTTLERSPLGAELGRPAQFGTIGADQLDNEPRVRFQQPPRYPYGAIHSLKAGTVVVEFGVNEKGRVYDARVVSSTDSVFEEPTLEAVRQWRFEPGRRNGMLVRFRMMLPVEFHLNEN
jgi:protein TonB